MSLFVQKYCNIVENSAENGHIHFLEWLKNIGFEFKYDNKIISNVSRNGHVHILEWFKNLGLSIPKKEKSEISQPIVINWTAVATITGSFTFLLALLTAIGVTEKMKQVLFPQTTPTVSPQKSPSSKP
jgi:hypothetical protein